MSEVKEPRFFSRTERNGSGLDETSSLDLFRGASGETIRGESSPYLRHASVPPRIKEVAPDAKIIILLRDPVQRAYSHYLMDVQQRTQTRSFAEAIRRELERPYHQYVEAGRYCHHVAPYLDLFGENVLVIFFEELFADVRTGLKEVFRFLGVDEGFADQVDVSPQNSYRGPLNALGQTAYRAYRGEVVRAWGRRLVPRSARAYVKDSILRRQKPQIDPETEKLLRDVYRDEPECLSRMLGRRVPWYTDVSVTEIIRGGVS
jgi:hypothetical protein